jgi:hypothetical protein
MTLEEQNNLCSVLDNLYSQLENLHAKRRESLENYEHNINGINRMITVLELEIVLLDEKIYTAEIDGK